MKFPKLKDRVLVKKPEVPTNSHLIDLSRNYKTTLPSKLRTRIEATREFLTEDIALAQLSILNGFQDGSDILRLAMEDEPSVGSYFSQLKNLTDLAIKVKMAGFVISNMGLSHEEKKVFLSLAFKETPVDESTVLLRTLEKIAKDGKNNSPVGENRSSRRNKIL